MVSPGGVEWLSVTDDQGIYFLVSVGRNDLSLRHRAKHPDHLEARAILQESDRAVAHENVGSAGMAAAQRPHAALTSDAAPLELQLGYGGLGQADSQRITGSVFAPTLSPSAAVLSLRLPVLASPAVHRPSHALKLATYVELKLAVIVGVFLVTLPRVGCRSE